MSSPLFWIDFITDPYNIFMLGIFSGLLGYFFSAGFMYTINVPRRYLWVAVLITILSAAIVWGLGYSIVIWYNTPLGPPLELVPK